MPRSRNPTRSSRLVSLSSKQNPLRSYIPSDKPCSILQKIPHQNLHFLINYKHSSKALGRDGHENLHISRRNKPMLPSRKLRPKQEDKNLTGEIRKRKRGMGRGSALGRQWRKRGQVGRMDKGNWGGRVRSFWIGSEESYVNDLLSWER